MSQGPSDVAGLLVEHYERRGTGKYFEAVTQMEHALQAGAHAMAAGADDATVVAAFLHDVGHLLRHERGEGRKPFSKDLHHEEVGADYLAIWFGADVTTPVRLHVPAKRYLCATEPSYFDELSPASVRSLQLQGGAMRPKEVEAFAADPHAAAAVELRRWDDLAKVPGAPTPGSDVFSDLIIDVLKSA